MKTSFLRKFTVVLIVAIAIGSHGILRADPGDDNPTGISGQFNGQVTTGCSYDPYTGNAKRSIVDIVVPGAVGAYPLAFTRTMNSRVDPTAALDFPFGKAGAWRHSYQWEVQSQSIFGNRCDPPLPHDYVVTYPDGRKVKFVPDGNNLYKSTTPGIGDRFAPIADQGDGTHTGYLLLQDGGKIQFDATIWPPVPPQGCEGPSSNWVWIAYAYTCKAIVDPFGQEITITRTGTNNNLIDTIQEPAGRNLKLVYTTFNSTRVIARVEERATPDASVAARTVQYDYVVSYGGATALANVSYFGVSTLTAHYTYQLSNAGGTNAPLIRTCDDPMYSGPMGRIAYDFLANGAHGFLQSERYLDGINVVGLPVSTLEITGPNTRKETRGDGPSRTFTYSGGLLKSWTNFRGDPFSQEHYTSGATGFVSYVVSGGNRTDLTRNVITGNVTHVIFPHTDSDAGNERGTVVTEYNSGSYPCYVMNVRDERQKVTGFTRDEITREVTDINYPDGAHEGFWYNDFGQVTWKQRKNGYYEHLVHDARGLLLHHRKPTLNGGPTSFEEPQTASPQTTFTYYPLGHWWQDRVKTVTDRRGKTTTYEYDVSDTNQPYAGRGQISKITHPDSKYLSFGYDARGNKLWEENELRERTSYTYDDYNRVTHVTTPLPNSRTATTTSTYDPPYHVNTPSVSPYVHTAQAVTTITSPTNVVTTHRYDEDFNRKQTTQGAQSVEPAHTHYGFDELGNVISVIDPRTYETKIEYDERNRRTKVTSPPISASGNAQYTTEWRYDLASNEAKITLPDASKIYQEFDPLNRLWTSDLRNAAEDQHRITSYTYYPSGKLKTLQDPKDQVTTFEYDGSDLKTKMTYPDEPGQPRILQGWVYDENGNVTERPTIGGPAVKQLFTYDDRNRMTHMRWSNGITDFSDFDYDYANRLKSAINPYSTITREYDEGGRLRMERQVLATTANTPAITITPVSVGSRKIHGAAGSFDVDLPLTGAAGIECRIGPEYSLVLTFANTIAVGGATVNSGVGQVASVTASANVVTVHLTDVSDAQLITVRVFGLSDGTNVGELIVPMHVLIGNSTGQGVVNAEDKDETIERDGEITNSTNFRSDVNTDGIIDSGDVTKVTIVAGVDAPTVPSPGPQANVSYIYYDDGTVKRITSPACINEYSYDGLGRLEWITQPGNMSVHYKYSYDSASNVIERTNPNGTSLSFVPDELNRIKEETITAGGELFSRLHYTYDSMGRLRSTLREEDSLLDTVDYHFTGELKTAQYGLHTNGQGGFENPEVVGGYTYDKAGNRATVNGVAFTPNRFNQYVSAGSNAVANGEQHEIAAYAGANYSYLADTRLAAVNSPSAGNYQLGYDALGRTVKRTTNNQATYFIYDGTRAIIEYGPSGTIIGKTLYGLGADEIIARTNNGSEQFLLQDRLGSTVAVTTWKGDVIEKYSYDVFGKPKIMGPDGSLRENTAINNRILFAGREWVSQFGFYENRARAYHPELGRFMSEDPLGFAGGDANLFRYCGNDPVNWTDPDGLDQESVNRSNRLRRVARAGGREAVNMGWGIWMENGLRKQAHMERMKGPEIMMRLGWAFKMGALVELIKIDSEDLTNEVTRALGSDSVFQPSTVTVDGIEYDTNGTKLNFLFVGRSMGSHGRAFDYSGYSLSTALSGAVHAVFQAAQAMGPGTGIIRVTRGTRVIYERRYNFRAPQRPAYGQGSALVSTGGGGWVTAGYFPGGGEAGEGFHPPAED